MTQRKMMKMALISSVIPPLPLLQITSNHTGKSRTGLQIMLLSDLLTDAQNCFSATNHHLKTPPRIASPSLPITSPFHPKTIKRLKVTPTSTATLAEKFV